MPELSRRITSIVAAGGDGWAVHYRATKLRAAGKPIVMLSIGDHDIKTDPAILRAMTQSAEAGHLGYTAMAGIPPLREAIARRSEQLNRQPARPENVIVTSGGQGAIFAAMTAVLDPGQSCVVLDPYYASFDLTVRAACARPIVVPTRADDGFQPDVASIEAALADDTRSILINTPNNPTGAVYARDRLEALADLCVRRDLWLISDELYDSQVFDGEHVSPRTLPGMAERTIVIGSMSKGFAMTGARIGWALGPRELIDRMVDLAGTTTYGLPGFLQDAAVFALQEHPELEAAVSDRYRRRRNIAVDAVSGSNLLRISPPQGGMYVMLDVRSAAASGIEFAEALLDEESIAVMPAESFGNAAAGHVRIALTVDDDALESSFRRIMRFAERHAAGGNSAVAVGGGVQSPLA
ncbi:MAG: pyridoxal phosphate-dependent aminotransferase [Pseudomonadota bacterium]